MLNFQSRKIIRKLFLFSHFIRNLPKFLQKFSRKFCKIIRKTLIIIRIFKFS